MSLIESIGLGTTWTPILTLGLMCTLLYIIHENTPKSKILRITGPQVPTFILALILTNTKIFPAPDYPLYSAIYNVGLPLSLALILLSIDVKAVVRSLGYRPFLLMTLGCFGTFFGGLIAGFIFRPSADAIKGLGGAVAMGVGGTENFMAAAISLKLDEKVAGAMLAVTMIPYTVSACINFGIAGSASILARLDSWIMPYQKPQDLAAGVQDAEGKIKYFQWGAKSIQALIAAACLTVVVSEFLGSFIKPIPLPGGGMITVSWILVLTTLALIIGVYTPVKRIPNMSNIGMGILYIAVMAIFARTDLLKAMVVIDMLPMLIFAYLLHHIFIFVTAKFLRVDALTTVTASMAAVGGAASAPMIPLVAGIKELIPLSILMSTLGYALANYLGWGVGQILLFVIKGITM